ncbi:Uncharacterised protein [Achromobacter denitrificans]|nr:Uncharacterised protein [Achromobacter denitrificans]
MPPNNSTARPMEIRGDGGWGSVRRSHSQLAQAAAKASKATNHQGLALIIAAARMANRMTAVTIRWPNI